MYSVYCHFDVFSHNNKCFRALLVLLQLNIKFDGRSVFYRLICGWNKLQFLVYLEYLRLLSFELLFTLIALVVVLNNKKKILFIINYLTFILNYLLSLGKQYTVMEKIIGRRIKISTFSYIFIDVYINKTKYTNVQNGWIYNTTVFYKYCPKFSFTL